MSRNRVLALGSAILAVGLARAWTVLAPREFVPVRLAFASERRMPDVASVRHANCAESASQALAMERAVNALLPEAPLCGARSLEERASAAVDELSADLRADFFDLAAWDCRARSLARGLTIAARDALSAVLTRSDDRRGAMREEHIAAGELTLLLEPPGSSRAGSLPAEVEDELLNLVLDPHAEPRLAAVAARPLAALGSSRARHMWIEAAAGDDDPTLAVLALRALGAVCDESLANDLIDALALTSSDSARERLVTLLGGMARGGAVESFCPGVLRAGRDALDLLARNEAASPSSRLRAQNALALWQGERTLAARPDGVLVALAESGAVDRARSEVGDLSRTAAARRRDVHILGAHGAGAASELALVLLGDPDAEVRSAAAVALSRSEPGLLAREALQRASASDPAATVRRQAAQGLAGR